MNHDDYRHNASDPNPLPARPDLGAAVTPLRLIFWGGLICILDIKINGFDLLNDTVGTILIAVGVFRLASFQVSPSYKSMLTFAQVISLLAILRSVLMQVTGLPHALGIFGAIVGLLDLAAIVCFCMAMQLLCRHASVEACARSWKTTTILFIAIYLIPLGIVYAVGLVSIVANAHFNKQFGPWALLLLPVFFAPLIHLFVSTSRMKRQAQAVAAVDTSPPRFE